MFDEVVVMEAAGEQVYSSDLDYYYNYYYLRFLQCHQNSVVVRVDFYQRRGFV